MNFLKNAEFGGRVARMRVYAGRRAAGVGGHGRLEFQGLSVRRLPRRHGVAAAVQVRRDTDRADPESLRHIAAAGADISLSFVAIILPTGKGLLKVVLKFRQILNNSNSFFVKLLFMILNFNN